MVYLHGVRWEPRTVDPDRELGRHYILNGLPVVVGAWHPMKGLRVYKAFGDSVWMSFEEWDEAHQHGRLEEA